MKGCLGGGCGAICKSSIARICRRARERSWKRSYGPVLPRLHLSEDADMRQRCWSLIAAELDRTRQALFDMARDKELLATNPWRFGSIEARNPYIDPRNLIQIDLLRRRRNLPADQRVLAAFRLPGIALAPCFDVSVSLTGRQVRRVENSSKRARRVACILLR